MINFASSERNTVKIPDTAVMKLVLIVSASPAMLNIEINHDFICSFAPSRYSENPETILSKMDVPIVWKALI